MGHRVTVLSVVLLILAAGSVVGARLYHARSTDTRIPIVVSDAVRRAVLGDMESIQRAYDALNAAVRTGDATAARAAAARAALPGPSRFYDVAPPHYLRLDSLYRSAFTEIGQQVGRMPPESLAIRLRALDGRCTACHGAFRVVVH